MAAGESRTVRAGRATGLTVRCSLTDTMVADVPVAVVFCYERAVDDDRLAKGLGTALDAVPVFGGRVDRDGDRLVITCDDSGVPMTTCDSADTLADAMSRVTVPGSGLVDPVNVAAGDDQLLRIRVNRLADGGMAIGCSWHHAVGDMRSFMALMRAWSDAVAGLPPPEVLVVRDRDAYLDAALPATDCGRPGFRLAEDGESERVRQLVESSARANRTVQIYFAATEIERMRSSYSAAAGLRLSTNDVLCAHVFTVIRQMAEDAESRGLLVPVDLRRQLGLPDAVIGNLVGDILLRFPADTAAASVAADLRSAVESYLSAHLNVRANTAFLATVEPEDCFPIGFDPGRGTVSVTNWRRFGIYDVVFDGCRPSFVGSAPQVLLPWVCWLVDGFGGDGVLFTAVLPAKVVGRLRGAGGQSVLHRFRGADEAVPEVRKLL